MKKVLAYIDSRLPETTLSRFEKVVVGIACIMGLLVAGLMLYVVFNNWIQL